MLDSTQISIYDGKFLIRTVLEKYEYRPMILAYTPTLKSTIIESLLMSVPIGQFVFVGFDTCVKGRNKLNSIVEFIDNQYKLTELNYLIDYEGLYFCELPSYLQHRILETYIPIIRINKSVPLEIQKDLIKRLDLS